MNKDNIIYFLSDEKHGVERLIKHIEHCEQCLRNRANAAFKKGISLEQFERELEESLNNIENDHTKGD